MPEPQLSPQEPAGWPNRKALFWSVVAALVLAAVALILLWQIRATQRQVSRLGAQIEESNRRVEQIARQSDQALERAVTAEQNARQAAGQRDQALQSQAKAETQARQARQEAAGATLQAAASEQKAAEYRRQREEELARLQQVLGQIAETRRSAMGLVMTLGNESIRFDFDKAEIKPQYRDILNRIAGVLMTLKGYQIYVYGYTDDIGTKEYNQALSERRAQSVRNFLVQAGLDPQIMTAKGFGEADPRAPGASPQARARNRRVEIGIVDSRLLPGATRAPGN